MATLTMSTSIPPTLKRRHTQNLSLDLSSLPQLSTPSPPSNTLLLTSLTNPSIFTPQNLESLTQAINALAPIHTFSPLKSMRRIILTFRTTASAISVRQALDGETILGDRVRVYFGANTRVEIDEEERHLQAPKSSRLFFISPPPSPPVGWEMRNEGPPNKDVIAEDLATRLGKLQARPGASEALFENEEEGRFGGLRKRAATMGASLSTTVVYDPMEHGKSPDLPAIAVEDTTMSPLEEGMGERRFERTARPPVELME